jgi:hypothetical protein
MSTLHKMSLFILVAFAGLCSQACHSAKATTEQIGQIGSHQVILHRDSLWILKRWESTILVSEANGKTNELKYKSILGRFEIRVKDDAVFVNDQLAGNLQKDDTIHFTDQGITINDMDWGESGKYLKQTLIAQK